MKACWNRLFAPEMNGPRANLALLVLRVWLGVSMLCNHGWDKLAHFKTQAPDFGTYVPLIGSSGNLALVVFAEFFCSILLVVGLLTRFAALVLAINMAVAFIVAYKSSGNGELAFIYLAGHVTLMIAGAGRYSVDGSLFRSEPKV